MLSHRPRRWSHIKTTLVQRYVFIGWAFHIQVIIQLIECGSQRNTWPLSCPLVKYILFKARRTNLIGLVQLTVCQKITGH